MLDTWVPALSARFEGVAELLMEFSKMEQRYQAVLAIHVDGLTVTEVAEKWGVSRQTVHAWLRRYEEAGLDGLADRSHRPASCRHQMPAHVEARVCELRRQHPDWGPVRIRHQLGRDGVDPVPSQMGIWRALVRHGLIEPNARRERLVDYKRWERGRPMELWQLSGLRWVMHPERGAGSRSGYGHSSGATTIARLVHHCGGP
jgi:transposase